MGLLLAISFAILAGACVTAAVASWQRSGARRRPARSVDSSLRSERRPSIGRSRDHEGVLLCSIDQLAQINAVAGHDVGDEVIELVAARLRAELLADLVSHRIEPVAGGLLLVTARSLPTSRDLALLADRLLVVARRPIETSDATPPSIAPPSIAPPSIAERSVTERSVTERSITLSIGMAGPGSEETAAALLEDADIARHQAKADGGDRRVVFSDELRAAAVSRMAVENELRKALQREELEVHYQPIVNAGSGKVDRFEGLVRWNHPTRRLLFPAAFLDVAVRAGLIEELGRYVLERACRQACRWTELTGRPITVSVNIDRAQLVAGERLVHAVGAALAETGLAPAQLELELPALSSIPDVEGEGDSDGIATSLGRLAALGVRLSLDSVRADQIGLDTVRRALDQYGWRSLLSTVKIDRSAVEHIAEVAGIGSAPDMLDCIVVGIEWPEQIPPVLEMPGVAEGGWYLQGFGLHRPAAPARLDQLLAPASSELDALSR